MQKYSIRKPGKNAFINNNQVLNIFLNIYFGFFHII